MNAVRKREPPEPQQTYRCVIEVAAPASCTKADIIALIRLRMKYAKIVEVEKQ